MGFEGPELGLRDLLCPEGKEEPYSSAPQMMSYETPEES